MKMILLLLLGFLSTTVHAEIYQWQDANGNTHFGDTPPPKTDSKLLNIESNTPPVAKVESKQQIEQDDHELREEIRRQNLAEKKIKNKPL